MPNAPDRRPLPDFALAIALIAAGFAIWCAVAALGGRREAWDSPYYWTVGMAALALATWIAARVAPRGSWRWPLCLCAGEFAALVAGSEEPGNLWPLTLVVFAVLAAPLLVLAHVVAARSRPV